MSALFLPDRQAQAAENLGKQLRLRHRGEEDEHLVHRVAGSHMLQHRQHNRHLQVNRCNHNGLLREGGDDDER